MRITFFCKIRENSLVLACLLEKKGLMNNFFSYPLLIFFQFLGMISITFHSDVSKMFKSDTLHGKWLYEGIRVVKSCVTEINIPP